MLVESFSVIYLFLLFSCLLMSMLLCNYMCLYSLLNSPGLMQDRSPQSCANAQGSSKYCAVGSKYKEVCQFEAVYVQSIIEVLFHHFKELIIVNLIIMVDIYLINYSLHLVQGDLKLITAQSLSQLIHWNSSIIVLLKYSLWIMNLNNKCLPYQNKRMLLSGVLLSSIFWSACSQPRTQYSQ